MAETGETPPIGVKGFFLAVRKKVYDNAVGSVAGAFVTIAIAIAIFVWKPLKSRYEDSLTELKNITPEEALRVARATVGSQTVFAIPFRNRDDESQYIAVWYETGYKSDPCASEKSPVPNWCELQLGPIQLDLLVGGDGTYERKSTHITSGTQAGGMDPEYLATITKAYGRPIQRNWGVIDRDHDGKKEILSIADSTGTSPTLPIYVSLYEVATGEVRQLRSYPSRFSVKNEFYNVDTSAVRTWLIARLKEFRGEPGDICNRDLEGTLTCSQSEAFKQAQAEEEKLIGTGDWDWMVKAEDDWVASNGVNFTSGRIYLSWHRGRYNPEQDCVGRTGSLEWLNVFKGPLVVNDLGSNRKAIAYLQDGDHHREIPAVIFGKRFIWLALAADQSILAIDPKTFELKLFEVPEFANGIPQSWSEEGKPPEKVSQQELDRTKDYQLDGLMLKGNRLVYRDIALTLSVPTDEFFGAQQCPE